MNRRLIIFIIFILISLCFAQNSRDYYSKTGLSRKRIIQKLDKIPVLKTTDIDQVVSNFPSIDNKKPAEFPDNSGEIIAQLLISAYGTLEVLYIKDSVNDEINRFIIKYLKESDYVVKVDRGYQPVKYSVVVKVKFSNGQFSEVVLDDESLILTPFSNTERIKAEYNKAYEVSELDKPPVLIKKAIPEYPAEARKAQIEGKVVVEVLIDETGRVIWTSIVKSVPGLDEAAQKTASKCVFTPAYSNGKPVKVKMTMPFDYHLR